MMSSSHHGAPPDHRRVLGDQVADRHGLDAVAFLRLEDLAVLGVGLAGDPHHPRQRGTVDVGIEDADLEALALERERQVDRGGRLADPALAGGDGDDGLDAGDQRLVGLPLTPRLAMSMAVSVVVLVGLGRGRGAAGLVGGQHGGDRKDPRQRLDRLLRGLPERLELRPALRLDLEGEVDVSALDRHALDHAERDHVLAAIGVLDPLQGVQNHGFRHLGHKAGPAVCA
jgi:hypothetical protein